MRPIAWQEVIGLRRWLSNLEGRRLQVNEGCPRYMKQLIGKSNEVHPGTFDSAEHLTMWKGGALCLLQMKY